MYIIENDDDTYNATANHLEVRTHNQWNYSLQSGQRIHIFKDIRQTSNNNGMLFHMGKVTFINYL